MQFYVPTRKVASQHDGDIHIIPLNELAKLYKISPTLLTEDDKNINTQAAPFGTNKTVWFDYKLMLMPRFHGDYDIVKVLQEQIQYDIIPSVMSKQKRAVDEASLWTRLKFLFTGKFEYQP